VFSVRIIAVLMGLGILGLISSTVFTGLVFAGAHRFAAARRKHRKTAREDFHPPVSLLKPLHGDEPNLEAHIASFFEQDYSSFEILFCARYDNDAGLQTARRVAARYPSIPVKFLTTGEPSYINAKVSSLEKMAAAATTNIFIISDSDVRVTANYIREVVAPFASAKVGAVTCLYRGVADEGLWAKLEAAGMSIEMTSGVLVANMMEGMQFTLGPTMAFRRGTIQEMGGFRVTADYCADDFILGNETHKLGQTVILSHHAIDHMVLHSNFAGSLKHQVRWMKSTRFSRPKGHFGTALTFSIPFGLLTLAAAVWLGHPIWGVGLFAWSIATRLALSIAVGRCVAGDKSWFGLLVLYPIRDFMGFCFWVASYAGNRILWRGRIFELLPGGKMRAARSQNPQTAN
jgi:ceramide glucosyltransferase